MQGVLFDVDDTLVDHSGAARTAIVGYLRSLGLDHDEEAVGRWRDVEERHFSRHLRGELSFQGQRRARVRDTLAPYGVSGAQRCDVPDGITRVTSLAALDGVVA